MKTFLQTNNQLPVTIFKQAAVKPLLQTGYSTLLNILIKYDGSIFSVSSDFLAIDSINNIHTWLNQITKLYTCLSKLSNRGFINNSKINLPLLPILLKKFKVFDKLEEKLVVILEEKEKEGSSYYIQLNKLFFNLILLLLFNMVILIEKQCSTKLLEAGQSCLINDLKTLRKNILRMIDPLIRDKISNKGLSILLNSVVGYDSEYELGSSIKKTNDLLSVQLAGNTGLILKVPIVDTTVIKPELISNSFYKGDKIEEYLKNIFCKSINNVVSDIRTSLYKENDDFLDVLLNKLSTIVNESKSKEIGSYKVFMFPKSNVKSFIKYINTYSSKDLIKDSDLLNSDNHEKSLFYIFELFNEIIGDKKMSDKLTDSICNSSRKPLSRITYRNGSFRLSVTINRTLYICMHESSADLSMLTDFDEFKTCLNIVQRSFVTLGKPLNIDGCYSRVHFRDTILLAPAGAKSLAGVGNLYGDEFKKIDIGNYRGNMSKLLNENKILFEQYAIRDSLITLKHANSMEEFNLSVCKLGVPLTISCIGKSYVLNKWDTYRYKGYQVRDDIIMGNLSSFLTPKVSRSLTPKGSSTISISNFIVPFITGYRGGRNEAFMYGIDESLNDRSWTDYDLTSCYTTVMSILGHPDYDNAEYLSKDKVLVMSNRDLLLNYIVMDVNFEFPKDIKYPCIPTRVDDDVDIYPQKGRSTITGSEYLVAKSMGCQLDFNNGVIIPFSKLDSEEGSKKGSINSYTTPFRNIVKELQQKRLEYPKKTFYNYMYKEIGNSIYGQIAMGISGKKTFDVATKSHIAILGGVLSNPVLACYITGFTRALIGESLHNIDKLNGKVISSTTDGFITDVTDLENKILSKNTNINCLYLYREMRRLLTDNKGSEYNENGLEIKNIESTGIISCKTRVQFGFTNGGISAATGFQTRSLEKSFIIEEFSRIIKEDSNKTFEYIQTGLRSANDIFKEGGHVIAKYSDRVFSLDYDNKRCIVDNGEGLLNSNPWGYVSEYEKIRVLKQTVTTPVYNKCFVESQSKSYKSYIETSVRGFVKACLNDIKNNRYGIPDDTFKNYKDIIDFVHNHEPTRVVRLTLSSMSRLKNRNSISRTVPRTLENESFISYVKEHIPDFEVERFFKELSDESIRNMKKQVRIN